MAPVICLVPGQNKACGRSDTCAARDFWAGLYDVVNSYVDHFTLEDLVASEHEKTAGDC